MYGYYQASLQIIMKLTPPPPYTFLHIDDSELLFQSILNGRDLLKNQLQHFSINVQNVGH